MTLSLLFTMHIHHILLYACIHTRAMMNAPADNSLLLRRAAAINHLILFVEKMLFLMLSIITSMHFFIINKSLRQPQQQQQQQTTSCGFSIIWLNRPCSSKYVCLCVFMSTLLKTSSHLSYHSGAHYHKGTPCSRV